MMVSYYIIYTNHFERPSIKSTIGKINNFAIITSICPKYYCTQLSWKIEIKIEKITFFTQSNLNFLH